MKKLILILFSFTLFFFSQAQNDEKQMRNNQMDALKVRFFTEELSLTGDESEKFWPLYYAFEKEKKEIRKSIKSEKMMLGKETTSDEDLKKSLNEIYRLECKLADEKKSLALKCTPLLGVQRTVVLMNAEDKLRRRITERVKKRIDIQD